MAKEENRVRSGPVSSGPLKFRGILFYYNRETGACKARFTRFATLKEAQNDSVEVECYGRPCCYASLSSLLHLADLLQKTAEAIPTEMAELEILLGSVFSNSMRLGAEREKQKHAHDIEVIIEDEPEGGGK